MSTTPLTSRPLSANASFGAPAYRPETAYQTVPAEMNFITRGAAKPQIFMDAGGVKGRIVPPPRSGITVEIENIRGQEQGFTFEDNGILFRDLPTQVTDFRDPTQQEEIYNAELVAALKTHLGAQEVLIFDHTVRVGDGDQADRKPVRHVHGDYTYKSGRERLSTFLGEERAAEWAKGRYAIINTWRPINGAVESEPLAYVDAASLTPGDMIATDLVYPDRTGEIFELAHNPDHHWIYLAGQTVSEVAIFKTFDSADANGAVPSTPPHSTFDDPNTPVGARPRHSIESRMLVRLG